MMHVGHSSVALAVFAGAANADNMIYPESIRFKFRFRYFLVSKKCCKGLRLAFSGRAVGWETAS
jgi:hypothetical protein